MWLYQKIYIFFKNAHSPCRAVVRTSIYDRRFHLYLFPFLRSYSSSLRLLNSCDNVSWFYEDFFNVRRWHAAYIFNIASFHVGNFEFPTKNLLYLYLKNLKSFCGKKTLSTAMGLEPRSFDCRSTALTNWATQASEIFSTERTLYIT